LNKQLVELQVQETSLLWFNTTLADGTKLDRAIVELALNANPGVPVVCLGSNAKKWFKANFSGYAPVLTVFHPQAWKRFRSKQPYALLCILQQDLDLRNVQPATGASRLESDK
jgi:hypothetical protein